MKKKDYSFLSFTELLRLNSFIGIVSVTEYNIQDEITLKQELAPIGFEVKVVKNKLFSKVISLNFPKYSNMVPLVQGFCLLVYRKDNEPEFSQLKKLVSLLKKNSKYLFLGGLYEDRLININFFKELENLKESDQIYHDLISTIGSLNASIVSKLTSSSKVLLFQLKNKPD